MQQTRYQLKARTIFAIDTTTTTTTHVSTWRKLNFAYTESYLLDPNIVSIQGRRRKNDGVPVKKSKTRNFIIPKLIWRNKMDGSPSYSFPQPLSATICLIADGMLPTAGSATCRMRTACREYMREAFSGRAGQQEK